MNLFSVLLVSFPEAVLVAVLGFLLTGIRPWWRDLLMIGALQAVLSFYTFAFENKFLFGRMKCRFACGLLGQKALISAENCKASHRIN